MSKRPAPRLYASKPQRFILILAVSGLVAVFAGAFAAKSVANGAAAAVCAQAFN